MKLFLASSLDKTLALLVPRLPSTIKRKVAFIANAADPFENTWWVELDRKAFLEAGFTVSPIDLRTVTAEHLVDELKDSGIVHVGGGSVFHALALLNKNGLADVVVRAIQEQGVVYTGTSAGSIIASESIGIYQYDPEEAKFRPEVTNFSGLGFVPFVVVPHCNNTDFVEANKIIVEHAPEFPIPLMFLHDEHAIWVEDEKYEIVVKK